MEVKVSTQEYDIISSGTIVSHGSETIIFAIEDLEFRAIFDPSGTSEDGNSPRVYTRVIRPEEGAGKGFMEVHLTNLDQTSNASSEALISMATINGRELFFKFAVSSMTAKESGREDKVFHYTWYLKK